MKTAVKTACPKTSLVTLPTSPERVHTTRMERLEAPQLRAKLLVFRFGLAFPLRIYVQRTFLRRQHVSKVLRPHYHQVALATVAACTTGTRSLRSHSIGAHQSREAPRMSSFLALVHFVRHKHRASLIPDRPWLSACRTPPAVSPRATGYQALCSPMTWYLMAELQKACEHCWVSAPPKPGLRFSSRKYGWSVWLQRTLPQAGKASVCMSDKYSKRPSQV